MNGVRSVRLFRERMGRNDQDLQSAFYAFAVVAFGGEPIWHVEDAGLDEPEESPLALVEKLIGIPRLLADEIDGKRLLSKPPDMRTTLRELRDAGALDFANPGQALLDATPAQLEMARVGARAWLEDFTNATELVEYRYGRDTAGLGLFGLMRKRDIYLAIASTTRFWLFVPALVSEDRLNEFTESVEKGREKLTAAMRLIEAFPGYKPLLTAGGEDRLVQLPQEEREQVSRTLTSYINQHPEVRCLLDE